MLTRLDQRPRHVTGRLPSSFIASSISAEISPSSSSSPTMQNSNPTVASLVCCSLATHSRSQSAFHQLLLPQTTMKGFPCPLFGDVSPL